MKTKIEKMETTEDLFKRFRNIVSELAWYDGIDFSRNGDEFVATKGYATIVAAPYTDRFELFCPPLGFSVSYGKTGIFYGISLREAVGIFNEVC